VAQKSITEMEHLPHSPDWAPNDLWLFKKINSASKERIFQDIENSPPQKKRSDEGTEAISQQEFQKCFQQWQHRWAKRIADQGEYFEGDPSQKAVSVQV
jgi:hypothetical protein